MTSGDVTGRRILVTGGSGFIGRHVVAQMTEGGATVRVVDRQPHPDPSVDIVLGDITDRAVVDRAMAGGIDSVVHLAAETSVLRSVQRPEETFTTNILGTQNVLEAARVAGVSSLAFASSNAVTGPMEEPAITERSRLRPLTPYGSTKAAGEMLMSAYTAAYGVRCGCVRLTNVYGPGMQAKDSIIARLMRAIRLGTRFEIYGDGEQVRDYVHAHDVVAAMRLALTDERWTGPMVIGAGSSLSVHQVVQAVRDVSGAELPVSHGAQKPGEMRAVIVDPSQARAAGWTPRYPTLEEGLVGVWEEWSVADVSAPAGS
jgi:UDP-glucose 4-epimerase